MAHRVIWTAHAADDLIAIAEFIARASASNARTVLRSIIRQTRRLEEFPRSGRVVPEYSEVNVRELQSYPYRILYRLVADGVEILAIIHGKQLLPDLTSPPPA